MPFKSQNYIEGWNDAVQVCQENHGDLSAKYEAVCAELEELQTAHLNGAIQLVGYTNGYQIYYGKTPNGGEGSFYSDTSENCLIPLYMLKTHLHRIETTTGMNITPEMVWECIESDKLEKGE